MSDEFINDPEETPIPETTAPEEILPGEVVPASEEAQGSDFDFPAESGVTLPDPQAVVTLRTSSGDTRYVPVTGPTPLSSVILASGLSIQGAMQYWLNGVQIDANTTVPAGETVTLIGSVKGGRQ